jgi:hypothetical protein
MFVLETRAQVSCWSMETRVFARLCRRAALSAGAHAPAVLRPRPVAVAFATFINNFSPCPRDADR